MLAAFLLYFFGVCCFLKGIMLCLHLQIEDSTATECSNGSALIWLAVLFFGLT